MAEDDQGLSGEVQDETIGTCVLESKVLDRAGRRCVEVCLRTHGSIAYDARATTRDR